MFVGEDCMTSQKESLRDYRKTSIKLLRGLIYFNPLWGGWGGGLFNLEKTRVSVLH